MASHKGSHSGKGRPAETPATGTRAPILDAAFRLFVRQGYHGTSMRQIAKEAGVSLGAAYNHFASKQDIFRTLLEERNPYAAMAGFLTQIEARAAAEPPPDVEAMLREAVEQAVDVLLAHPDFFRLLFIDILEFQGANIGQAAVPHVARILDFFQRLVARGQASGQMRPVSAIAVMRAFAGLLMSGFLLETAVRPVGMQIPIENWPPVYADILAHGIMRPVPLGPGDLPPGGE